MPDNIRFTVVERNGIELQFHEEEDFLPELMPFSDVGFVADNVKDAIIEAPQTTGLSRGSLICGYGATSGVNRWMEFFEGNASNTSPIVFSETAEFISVSVSNKTIVNGSTFTIYRNGIAINTLTIVSSTTAYITYGSPMIFVAGDTLSVQQTSTPSTSEPTLKLNFKYLV